MTPTPLAASKTINIGSGLPILILAVSGFVLVTTEFLIIGLIPSMSADLGISTTEAGWLVSLFAFTVMLCGPFLTAKLVHVDRKRLFGLILLVFAGANLLAAISPNVWVLALARFIPALVLPVFWGTASETAARISEPHHAGRAVGRVYLGISAALVLGVPLGTIASTYVGWRGAFVILAVISLLLAFIMWRIMPTLPASPRYFPGHHQSDILKAPRFLLQVGLSVVLFTGMFTAYTYLAETLEKLAGIDSTDVGWWLMGFGLIGLLGNWLGGIAADRSALGATLGFTILLTVAMLLISSASQDHWLLALVLALWGVAYTGLFPICQIRVMKAGSKAQALAATVNVSAANAGAGLGAIIGGFVISRWQLANLGYAAAVICLLGLIFSVVLLMSRKKDSL